MARAGTENERKGGCLSVRSFPALALSRLTRAPERAARRLPKAMILDVTEPTVHGVLPSGSRPRASGPLLLALGLHGVLITFVLWHGPRLLTRQNFSGDPLLMGARAGGGGGGGGEQVVFILPPAPPAAPAPAVETPVAPVPVETPVAPPVETEVQPAAIAQVDSSASTGTATGAPSPGTGGGTGGGQGTGTGPGTGPGTGAGTGAGDGGNVTPPSLIAFPIHPASPPKDLKGKTVTLTMFLTRDGRVEEVDFEPAIKDGKYRDYLRQIILKSYRFRPARDRAGTAIPATYVMSIDLPTK